MIALLLSCSSEAAPGLSEHAQSDEQIHASQQAQIDDMKKDVAEIKAKLIEAFPEEAAAAGVAPAVAPVVAPAAVVPVPVPEVKATPVEVPASAGPDR
jgi:hypothetical protein